MQPRIPTSFPAVKQNAEGHFEQPDFEKVMRMLELRGRAADRVYNIGDAKGEVLTLQGDVFEYEKEHTAGELTPGQRLRLEGYKRRAENRINYLEENVDRWQLELKALKALLSGATE